LGPLLGGVDGVDAVLARVAVTVSDTKSHLRRHRYNGLGHFGAKLKEVAAKCHPDKFLVY
jgi:hypothetical protein